MADSNLDWGQDLPTLRSALERLPSQNGVLSYFGTAAPVAYGVEVDILDAERKSPLEGYDFLAISVNHLYGLHATTSTVGFMQTELLQTEPFARAGDSILIYDLRSANKWEIWK